MRLWLRLSLHPHLGPGAARGQGLAGRKSSQQLQVRAAWAAPVLMLMVRAVGGPEVGAVGGREVSAVLEVRAVGGCGAQGRTRG